MGPRSRDPGIRVAPHTGARWAPGNRSGIRTVVRRGGHRPVQRPEGASSDHATTVLVTGDPPVGFASVEIVDGVAHLAQLSVLPWRPVRVSAPRWSVPSATGRRPRLPGGDADDVPDVPWNGPFYARLGFRTLDELTPGLAAIRDHEKAIGDDDFGPRIAMRKDPGSGRIARGACPVIGRDLHRRDPFRLGHHGQMPDPPHHPDADALAPTDRSTLRRKKERGSHDRKPGQRDPRRGVAVPCRVCRRGLDIRHAHGLCPCRGDALPPWRHWEPNAAPPGRRGAMSVSP